jgi:hypothetical protein
MIITTVHARVLAFLAAGLVTCATYAQQSQTVGTYVVNFGIVPAEVALGTAGHREAHPITFPPGSQHLLITLDDAKSGKRVGDAEVVIDVTDPKGRVVSKPLLHTSGGGMPDYSELFTFGWSGRYSIQATITPKPAGKPLVARFTVDHVI